jgi:hypothetical protein
LISSGNIALHLFLQETRELYDLESLWALGAEFDEQSQNREAEEEIFYNAGILAGLKPAETSTKVQSTDVDFFVI